MCKSHTKKGKIEIKTQMVINMRDLCFDVLQFLYKG